MTRRAAEIAMVGARILLGAVIAVAMLFIIAWVALDVR